MENKIKLVITITIVFGICAIGYFMVFLPYTNRGEGDPFFDFIDVPVNDTINSSVIHLEDKDIMNVQGLDVRQENGKITRIYFRYSETTPEISTMEFKNKYGSRLGDPSSRKYLEYKGVYYFTYRLIP